MTNGRKEILFALVSTGFSAPFPLRSVFCSFSFSDCSLITDYYPFAPLLALLAWHICLPFTVYGLVSSLPLTPYSLLSTVFRPFSLPRALCSMLFDPPAFTAMLKERKRQPNKPSTASCMLKLESY
jgi:hypothetical protein